jgi:hypothetical protein
MPFALSRHLHLLTPVLGQPLRSALLTSSARLQQGRKSFWKTIQDPAEVLSVPSAPDPFWKRNPLIIIIYSYPQPAVLLFNYSTNFVM